MEQTEIKETNPELEIIPEISQPESFKRAEWVFQFDKEEPIVFAWSNDPTDPGEININIKPNSSSGITFTDKDGKRTFSLFSREISEETLKLIEERKKLKEENN